MALHFCLLVHGELIADIVNDCFNLICSTFEITGGHADTLGNELHFFCAQASGGYCRSANTDTAGDSGLLGITGDRIFI